MSSSPLPNFPAAKRGPQAASILGRETYRYFDVHIFHLMPTLIHPTAANAIGSSDTGIPVRDSTKACCRCIYPAQSATRSHLPLYRRMHLNVHLRLMVKTSRTLPIIADIAHSETSRRFFPLETTCLFPLPGQNFLSIPVDHSPFQVCIFDLPPGIDRPRIPNHPPVSTKNPLHLHSIHRTHSVN